MISDLEMWRCFEAAVAFRTFHRAARELSLTMRMFEYRIRCLEEEVLALLAQRSRARHRDPPGSPPTSRVRRWATTSA